MKITDTLSTFQCPVCGVTGAAPESLLERKRENHDRFYCVNGHSLSFASPTEADALRKQLQTEREARAAAQKRATELQNIAWRLNRWPWRWLAPLLRRDTPLASEGEP